MYVDCFSVLVWVGFGCCREILSILTFTYNRVKSAMGSRWFYTSTPKGCVARMVGTRVRVASSSVTKDMTEEVRFQLTINVSLPESILA